MVDADQERAAGVARAVGAEQAESPQALLDSGVDALVIAAATPAHAELLHMAADASVPAFCEKPSSGTSAPIAYSAFTVPASSPVWSWVNRG